jgi:ABC-type lipoprotein export system ATPase subunit
MSMIDSMTGVSVRCDWLYTNSQKLEFFPKHSKPPKKYRVAAVYGKNGSGKSTIAQGFREYIDSTLPGTVELLPLKNGTPMQRTHANSLEKFLIFDENYVEQQVKVKDQGLEAIVLFGEQVSLDQEIEKVITAIGDLKIQKTLQEKECDKYLATSNVMAPEYWLNKIARDLKASKGWAEKRGIDINGGKQKANVNEQEVDRIGLLQPSLSEEETTTTFDNKYVLFSKTKLQEAQTLPAIQKQKITANLEEKSSDLFIKTIPTPQISEREKKILDVFDIKIISEAKGFLLDTSNSKCPKCLQDISDEHRTEMLSSIEIIINKEVNTFQTELRELLQVAIPKDAYNSYSELNAEVYSNVQICLDAFNEAVEKHNNAVQIKIDNPFDIVVYDITINLAATCDNLNEALDALEIECGAFNNAIIGRVRLKNELLKLNDEIASYNIKDNYSKLVDQRVAKKEAYKKLKALDEQIEENEKQKRELDAKRRNFQIAVEDINDSLAYIFFSRDRLKLVLNTDDNLYRLKSNGKEVDPKKVSCGERNALALSYYFTEIAKETDVRTIYSDEVFLVIDDPVSSFDVENRVGILSFLRWKLGQVLLGCPTTKVLVMTHDISVLYDMQKALEEIANECTDANRSAEYGLFELVATGIEPFQFKRHNEYMRLLETIYDYALNGTSETELFIGNTMRRVLEAFSTFLYRKGIADISYNQEIMSELDEDKRIYFQNLMYRLVLHGESHYEENIRCMDFFNHLSKEDKQRTARDILCFMYLLYESHIRSHLSPEAESEIKGWVDSIGTVSTVEIEFMETDIV